jgi:hypothetical protein
MKARNDITLKTCHDIRHWTECGICNGIGDDRRMLVWSKMYVHGACLVENVDRKHILRMPKAELAKLTLADAGVELMTRLVARL